MFTIFLLTQVLNPSLSFSVVIPDENTESLFSHFNHIRLENSFTEHYVAPVLFIDYFFMDEYPYHDPYFINSGLPFTLRAAGAGIGLRLSPFRKINFDLGIGYFAGEFRYPVVNDSGVINKKNIRRKSLGATVAFGVFEKIGAFNAGVKIHVNVIPFGARKEPRYWPYEYSLFDYASLNSVGIGFRFGLNRREER